MLKRCPSTYEFETRNMLNVSFCDTAITRLSPMKNLKTTVKGAQNKKPEKEDIGDGGSVYFK